MVHRKTLSLALWDGSELAPARGDNGHSVTTTTVQQPQLCHWVTEMLKFINRIYSHLGVHQLQSLAQKPELI